MWAPNMADRGEDYSMIMLSHYIYINYDLEYVYLHSNSILCDNYLNVAKRISVILA